MKVLLSSLVLLISQNGLSGGFHCYLNKFNDQNYRGINNILSRNGSTLNVDCRNGNRITSMSIKYSSLAAAKTHLVELQGYTSNNKILFNECVTDGIGVKCSSYSKEN